MSPGLDQEQNRARPSRRRDSLRREIVFTLLVKIVVIYALWYAFFSDPVDDGLTDAEVGSVVFGRSSAGQVSAEDPVLVLKKSIAEEK